MKTGRNDPCPCGSGRKYKRCCAGKKTATAARQPVKPSPGREKLTLGSFIKRFQDCAGQKKEAVGQVGVFLLFADVQGDAWVLEMSQADAIQISAAGVPLEVPLEENEETIVVDWSHTFSFKNKQLTVTSYRSKESRALESAPSQQLHAVHRKFLKKLSPEMLARVHIEP